MKSFLLTNRDICNLEVDTNLSGSTTVAILMKQNKLISANVGDSRAITCKMNNLEWTSVPLTIDHKPGDERERKRILERGGRVDC